jgi:thioredoxin-related protein
MKIKNFCTAILLVISISSFAQDWTYDINKAKQQATSEEKEIVLVFAGSDWCAPCIKLEKKIWESEQFQRLAKDTFVMLKADFPRRKKNRLPKQQQKHNDALAEKYNRKGNFPLVVVLDKNGNVKGKVGYENISPIDYYKKLKAL